MATKKKQISQFEFRPLTVSDIDEIVQIDERIVRRTRSPLFRKQLEEQIIKHGEESLGALYEGKLVGYLLVSIFTDQTILPLG
ncbi:MAG: hypothetical protein ACXAC6_19910 [Candidatus Hodarchaeales archaeon]|jgi:predicted N-acetyltransferase YhbS